MAMLPPSNDARELDGRPVTEPEVSSEPGQELNLLEKDVPVSQSLIWRLQRESYAQRGLKSWTEDLVPQFITNNPFIAEIYARIVFGFICDCFDREGKGSNSPSARNPVRILEVGAGTGKFSFLFLRQLEALLGAKDIPLGSVCYCMSDCSDALIESWRANKLFSEYSDRGILQFERLDVSGEINSPFLRGNSSTAGEPAQFPLVVLANYVFDSLPYDAFVVKEGRLFELLQTTATRTRGTGNGAPEALSQARFSYRHAEVRASPYADNSWNEVLDLYRRRVPAATVLFPSQALKTLDALSKSTAGAMLVLAADKGYVHEDSFLPANVSPAYEFHSANCFSQLVNFDAIAKHFAATGGDSFLPEKHSSSLHVCAFLGHRGEEQFPSMKASIRQARSAIGPGDLFALLAWLNPHMEEMSVPQILALMRLSRWDTTTFTRLFPVLARQIRGVSGERNDLRDAILLTWANYFPVVPSDHALAFQCGVILLELHFFEDAFSMFKQSQEALGRSATTSYNLGLCSSGLQRSAEALAFLVEACDLDPHFEPAHLMRRKLENEQSVK